MIVLKTTHNRIVKELEAQIFKCNEELEKEQRWIDGRIAHHRDIVEQLLEKLTDRAKQITELEKTINHNQRDEDYITLVEANAILRKKLEAAEAAISQTYIPGLNSRDLVKQVGVLRRQIKAAGPKKIGTPGRPFMATALYKKMNEFLNQLTKR